MDLVESPPVLRLGILGLGRAGSSFIPAIQRHPHVKLASAATLDKERLMKFSLDFGVETYESAEDLCKSSSIDAVYIATPTELHTQHVLLAAQNKKHIIVEKPLAINLDDADLMINAVEQNGVIMIVGHSHSFELPIRAMRDIIRSGELGKLKMIHNWYFNNWLYRPRTPDELVTALGGGVTFRQGSHQFDIIRYLAGGDVGSVRAKTGIWDHSRPTEGSHCVFLQFKNDVVATAVYNGTDHFHSTELTFGIGEGGPQKKTSIYGEARKNILDQEDEIRIKHEGGYGGSGYTHEDNETSHHPFFGLTIVSCEKGDIRQSPEGLFVYGESDKYEVSLSKQITGRDEVVSELYDAVTKKRPAIHDGRWAKANLEVCLATIESSKSNKEIYLSHQVER